MQITKAFLASDCERGFFDNENNEKMKKILRLKA